MTEVKAVPLEDVALELQQHILDGNDVKEFLDRLARHAAEALSVQGRGVHCGVTLLRHKKAGTVGSSGARARAMDELQYDFAEGPCLSAAKDQEVFHIPDLDAEDRWPDYINAVSHTGVKSILAVPFDLGGDAMGALNLYAEAAHSFPEPSVVCAVSYAAQASAALRLAVRIAALSETKDNLIAAMESRTTIDIAVGVIMAQNRCTQADAFEILRRASSSRNLKLRDIAAKIIESTSGAEARTHFDA